MSGFRHAPMTRRYIGFGHPAQREPVRGVENQGWFLSPCRDRLAMALLWPVVRPVVRRRLTRIAP